MLRGLLFAGLLLSPASALAGPGSLTVVIDAGHGGSNKGAAGVTGALEKRVTLHAAKRLRRALARLGGVRVVMTRSRDRYLTLSERVRRANRARGHLFVSLHCNASPKKDQQGFEAFVLTPQGVDQQARPLARKALTVDAVLRSFEARRLAVDGALADLARRGLRRRAVRFGRLVIAALQDQLGKAHNRGLQQAKFDVLMGLRMPGVLVEMGFLDHPVQGRRVPTTAYLDRIVAAVVKAVASYGARHTTRAGATGADGPAIGPRPGQRRRDRRRPDPTQDPKALPRKPELALEHRV